MNEIPPQILDIYFWYKVGNACYIVAVGTAAISGFLLFLGTQFYTDGEKKIGAKLLIISALSFLLFIPSSIVACATPSRQDLKEASLLIIGKQAADSDAAQRLINAIISRLENK